MANYTAIIKRLQNAINDKYGAKILYSTSQWYSDDQSRPVTVYKVNKAIYDDKTGRNRSIELFSSYSQIQIVLWLRDYWYELNNWDIPKDNETWNRIKQEYNEKHVGG